MSPDDDDDDGDGDDELVEPALTDQLDLHTFRPRDCGDVVAEYVRAAQEAGFARVRIIHGKGIGNLRRTAHAVLERHPAVASFAQADANWGATLVELKPRGLE
jgi:DNA-nicking Smr family endonuclease